MWCHFVVTTFHFHGWYYYCHEFILDWFCVHSHSWTQTLCIKQGVSDLHWHQFSSCHDDSPQFSSVKAGRQQIWVRWQEFVWVVPVLHFTELRSSLLNHIASPKNLTCVWIPKVAHIRTHLILKLIILIYWLRHFIILHFFLVNLIFKTFSTQVPFVLSLYSSHIKYFSIILILSITNHYMTYNLSVLQHCFYVSSLCTHRL